MENKAKVKIIVLAAGKGTRMENDTLPKVLSKVKGISMIHMLLDTIHKSEVDHSPIIIVGYKKEEVEKELGDQYTYVHQKEQLGTGHAVSMARDFLKDKANHILVLYGDQPLIKPETIQNIITEHLNSKNKITITTVSVSDFEDFRTCFDFYSRVVRDQDGKIKKTVEKKDATEEELKIKEVNPSQYCFDANWLWEKIQTLKNDNSQKEYYLPDLIKIAIDEGVKIESIPVSPIEALGANTKNELLTLENFIR